MALNETRTWLIAYDISNPKRLLRVHRYLKTVATPVQYSLFVAEESTYGIQRIHLALEELIDPRNDDVRIYPLPRHIEIHHYGRSLLPAGLLLLTDKNRPSTGIFLL